VKISSKQNVFVRRRPAAGGVQKYPLKTSSGVYKKVKIEAAENWLNCI